MDASEELRSKRIRAICGPHSRLTTQAQRRGGHLKPVDPADYPAGAFSNPANLARLNAIFPSGVCDWSQPSVGQIPTTAVQWSTFAGGAGFVPLGDLPVSR